MEWEEFLSIVFCKLIDDIRVVTLQLFYMNEKMHFLTVRDVPYDVFKLYPFVNPSYFQMLLMCFITSIYELIEFFQIVSSIYIMYYSFRPQFQILLLATKFSINSVPLTDIPSTVDLSRTGNFTKYTGLILVSSTISFFLSCLYYISLQPWWNQQMQSL